MDDKPDIPTPIIVDNVQIARGIQEMLKKSNINVEMNVILLIMKHQRDAYENAGALKVIY